jgi:hypothetical protein
LEEPRGGEPPAEDRSELLLGDRERLSAGLSSHCYVRIDDEHRLQGQWFFLKKKGLQLEDRHGGFCSSKGTDLWLEGCTGNEPGCLGMWQNGTGAWLHWSSRRNRKCHEDVAGTKNGTATKYPGAS